MDDVQSYCEIFDKLLQVAIESGLFVRVFAGRIPAYGCRNFRGEFFPKQFCAYLVDMDIYSVLIYAVPLDIAP